MASIVATPEKGSVFEPSEWGDYFIEYELKPMQRSEEWMRERADGLKKNIRNLFETCDSIAGRMALVDELQHLGIDHLFEEQIDTTLNKIHRCEFISSSLHEVAVRFRLLREHGFWVSPDVFNKFKGKDGEFGTGIKNEPRGLLSLYNAAYLFVHGEPELEEAISFSRHHLNSMRGSLKSPLAEQVNRSLYLPLTRTYKRMEALQYISEYHLEKGHNSILLDLAKLDFNLLQNIHLKELKFISEWWKNFYGYVGLNYSRYRVVESYFWSYIVFHEHDFAKVRMIFAKIIQLTTTMDDTYDSHATIEESREFNAAIQRWDRSAISLVPDYLKKFYKELLSNFKQYEDEVAISENYRISYTTKAFQNLSNYYCQEAEWLHQNHKPCFQDQVNLSAMSSAVPMLSVAMMIGMGNAITEEVVKWVAGVPDVVLACAKIGRFMNDIAAFKKGKNRGDVTSSLECYINENRSESDAAIASIDSLVEDEWKTTNEARFQHRELVPAVERVIKFTVSMQLFYDERKDAFTFTRPLRETIETLFVKPIPI